MINLVSCGKVLYSKHQTIVTLNNISIEIKRSDFVAIISPRWSGKTTLLNVLGLNNPPTRGQYSFEWLEVSDLGYSQISDIRNIKVRFVQTNLLIEEFNILENVSMALGYRGVGS